MQLLLALSRLIDCLNRWVGRTTVWLILCSVLISAGNAVVRKAFGVSSNAWLEAQWYLFAVIVLFGASQTLRLNGHVRVDLFYGQLTPRAQVWLDLVCLALFLMPASLLLTGMSWTVFAESWRIGEVSSNAGGLVRWPVKLVLPLGFGLLALQGLAEMVRRAAMLSGAIPLSVQYERPLQ